MGSGKRLECDRIVFIGAEMKNLQVGRGYIKEAVKRRGRDRFLDECLYILEGIIMMSSRSRCDFHENLSDLTQISTFY